MKNYFDLNNDIESICIYGNTARSDVDLTIVVPTYKRKDLLEKALLSIVHQKQPTVLKYQVLIVSNDPEYEYTGLNVGLDKNLFSVYRNKKNLGMVGNMNRCAKLAQGKYVAYIQDDDILLDDFLITTEKLILDGSLENIDCLIPNRYYFYDQTNKDSNFGEQAYKSEKKKLLLKQIISIGKKKNIIQRITSKDCVETWFNCYGGGPTCGMIFKRESLMKAGGFNDNYPYAFDYVFFVDFSDVFNVCLYDKYLSVYRMSDSASNRPEVQVDFFRSDMYLLNKTKCEIKFVRRFEQEIIKFSVENKSLEAQKLIGDEGNNCAGKVNYIFFRAVRFIRLMRRNVYRRELVPSKFIGQL